MPGEKVLVVDDDENMLAFLETKIRAEGFRVTGASNGEDALACIEEQQFDVALVDLVLPNLDGLELIRIMRENKSHQFPIVVLTGSPSMETAISAVSLQVYDYLRKPRDLERLGLVLHQAVRAARKFAKTAQWIQGNAADSTGSRRRPSGLTPDLSQHLIGKSPKIEAVREQIRAVAESDMNVLIVGETGTGKGVTAELIHQSSGRAERGSFIKVSCPSIPESLFESEIFGHEEGSFTGASQQRKGYFEQAIHGTIFLDEIGILSPAMQAKLLECVESREFMRVGGQRKLIVDSRILAATNEKLKDKIDDRSFRADLYYRLRHFVIHMPPLRERPEDIPLLLAHFLKRYSVRYAKPVPEISSSLIFRCVHKEWPGNVRELEATVSRYVLTPDDSVFEEEPDGDAEAAPEENSLTLLEAQERQTIASALGNAGGNMTLAAELLGVSYSTLRRRVAKFNL